MTDAFKQGFKAKCFELGFDGDAIVKAAEEPAVGAGVTEVDKPALVDTYGGRTAVSAGVGALLGALYEAAKSKEQKKYWLESILNGALGGAAAGAGSLAIKRNVMDPAVDELYQFVHNPDDAHAPIEFEKFIASIRPDGTSAPEAAKPVPSTPRQVALDEALRRYNAATRKPGNGAAIRSAKEDYERRMRRPDSFWEEAW